MSNNSIHNALAEEILSISDFALENIFTKGSKPFLLPNWQKSLIKFLAIKNVGCQCNLDAGKKDKTFEIEISTIFVVLWETQWPCTVVCHKIQLKHVSVWDYMTNWQVPNIILEVTDY